MRFFEFQYEDMFQGLNPKSDIYVDMDGVLADFFGEWKKLVGKDWRELDKDEIEPALKKIRDDDKFWLNIPLTSNAKNLLSIIKQVKGNYKILSSPLANDPNSEPHKREWIEKNLDFFPPTEVIITKDKAKYATNPDGTPNILIDDYGVNIAAWESAGGIGFKHKDHKFERTAKKLKAEIEESFQHLLREHIEENFADGKVKGKSRPGRVKRAGASCNGSVTSLRKRAKNASGERAKMYHWCANMKSGRNKG
jgi:5'(3')-deoxyribonucleotidase